MQIENNTLPSATLANGPTGLVEQLERLIEERNLKPGDRLPSIRELADQYGVSAERIRQVEKAAMTKIKKHLSA